MGRVENMAEILAKVKSRGLFKGIGRWVYDLDMEMALEIIEGIGKDRDPRFCIDNDNRFTYENLIKWAHCDTSMKCIHPETKQIIPGDLKKGLYIAGNTGTGKSWALEILAAYAMVCNFQIQFGENKRCLYWGNVRTDIICDKYKTEGTFDNYKQMSIIGIQDLGAEPIESMYMGNRENVLRQILEYRGDRSDQMTLITSNLPMTHKVFIDKYDDRVASRLNKMCNYFEIKGKDRRKL